MQLATNEMLQCPFSAHRNYPLRSVMAMCSSFPDNLNCLMVLFCLFIYWLFFLRELSDTFEKWCSLLSYDWLWIKQLNKIKIGLYLQALKINNTKWNCASFAFMDTHFSLQTLSLSNFIHSTCTIISTYWLISNLYHISLLNFRPMYLSSYQYFSFKDLIGISISNVSKIKLVIFLHILDYYLSVWKSHSLFCFIYSLEQNCWHLFTFTFQTLKRSFYSGYCNTLSSLLFRTVGCSI